VILEFDEHHGDLGFGVDSAVDLLSVSSATVFAVFFHQVVRHLDEVRVLAYIDAHGSLRFNEVFDDKIRLVVELLGVNKRPLVVAQLDGLQMLDFSAKVLFEGIIFAAINQRRWRQNVALHACHFFV